MKSKILIICFLFLFSVPNIANAQSAGEVLDQALKPYRTGYLVGLMAMHSYYAVLANDRQRADCIAIASNEDATINRILRAFDRWRDKPAAGLVILVMNKACPK